MRVQRACQTAHLADGGQPNLNFGLVSVVRSSVVMMCLYVWWLPPNKHKYFLVSLGFILLKAAGDLVGTLSGLMKVAPVVSRVTSAGTSSY